MSAPTFIAKATAVTGTGATQNQPYMGSIVAGDLLIIAALSYQEPGGSIGDIEVDAGDPGWEELGGGIAFRDSSLNNVGTFKAFAKIADGTESGNITLNRTGSNGGSNAFLTQMYQFRGTPLHVSDVSSNINGDGDATISIPIVGVIGNEATTIALIGQLTNDPGTPAGYTNEATDNSGGVVLYIQCDVKEVSTGAAVTASNGDADGWATIHIGIFSAKGRNYIVNN